MATIIATEEIKLTHIIMFDKAQFTPREGVIIDHDVIGIVPLVRF